MTELFLAVDGGQTATIAIMVTVDGAIVGVGRGGPLRHRSEPSAATDARRVIEAAVGGALEGRREDDTLVCCCLALTGSEAFAEAAVRSIVPGSHIRVLENDALAALASGTVGGGGVGLIAGTGSVAVAAGRDGGPVQVGGWGWLLGDEGGASWIGLEGLRAAARAIDGTGPTTILVETLPAWLAAASLQHLRDDLTRDGLDRRRVAALAEAVVAAADAGDVVAAAIADDAADRLASLVMAALRAAPFLESDERLVVPSGGVVRPGGRIITRLRDALANAVPDVRVVLPEVPPVVGAFYLALSEHGMAVSDETRSRLRDEATAWDLWRKIEDPKYARNAQP